MKKGKKFYAPFPKFIERRIGNKLGISYGTRDISKYYHTVNSPISIGIKGMPGRPGLTQAQKGLQGFYTYDKDSVYLQKLLGEDFRHYKEFLK
jgi:hypothetical protein